MGKRVNQLRSKPAIIGWVTIAVFIWKVIEALDTLKGVVENMNTVWNFLSTPIGMLVLLLVGLGLIAYSVFRKEHKALEENKTELVLAQKETLSWLGQELSSDLQRISKGMRGRTTRWDFSGIYKREPYFDVFVELTDTTIFTFSLKSLSGFMKIAGEPCVNPPQVSTRFGIKRDEPADIRFRQPIAPETVAIIQDAGNSNQEIEFNLGEVIFEIENTTEGYEKYKPHMTGGIFNIVPKDGLHLIPQLTIEVLNARLLVAEPYGHGTGQDKPTSKVEVGLTFHPTNPPLQLARLQLCCGENRIDTDLPTKLIERRESYTVIFKGSHAQIAGGRRGEHRNEYYGYICALAGGEERCSNEFRFA